MQIEIFMELERLNKTLSKTDVLIRGECYQSCNRLSDYFLASL